MYWYEYVYYEYVLWMLYKKKFFKCVSVLIDLLIDLWLVGGIVECIRYEIYFFGNFFKGVDLVIVMNV